MGVRRDVLRALCVCYGFVESDVELRERTTIEKVVQRGITIDTLHALKLISTNRVFNALVDNIIERHYDRLVLQARRCMI